MRKAVFVLLPWLLLLPLIWCSGIEEYSGTPIVPDKDCGNEGGDPGLTETEINEITNGQKCNATWVDPSKSAVVYGLKGFVRNVTEKCLETQRNKLSLFQRAGGALGIYDPNKAAKECALNTIAKSGCQPERGQSEHPLSYVIKYYEANWSLENILEKTSKCVARYKKAPKTEIELLPSCKVNQTLSLPFNCSKRQNITEDNWRDIVVPFTVNRCLKSVNESWTDEEGLCIFTTLFESCGIDDDYALRACKAITGYANFCVGFSTQCGLAMNTLESDTTTIAPSTDTIIISTTTEATEAPNTDTPTGDPSTTSDTDQLTTSTSIPEPNPDESSTEAAPSLTVEESTTFMETTEVSTTESEAPEVPTTEDPLVLVISTNPTTEPTSPIVIECNNITTTEDPSSTSAEASSSTSIETSNSDLSETSTILITTEDFTDTPITTEALTSSETSETNPTSRIPPGPPKENTRNVHVEDKNAPPVPPEPMTTAAVEESDEGGMKSKPRAEMNQKPADEEEGPNLVALWVVLGIMVGIGAIIGIIVGVVLKKRHKKKKEQAEALKNNSSLKKNIGGELGLPGRPPYAKTGTAGLKGPVGKQPPKKSPAAQEMKQMEAGVIDKHFTFTGPLTVDVAIRKGQTVAHATGDDDGHEIDKVIFDHDLNKVIDIGSNIEKVSTEELATVTIDRTDNTVEGASRKGKSKERIEKVVVETKPTDKSNRRKDSSGKGK